MLRAGYHSNDRDVIAPDMWRKLPSAQEFVKHLSRCVGGRLTTRAAFGRLWE